MLWSDIGQESQGGFIDTSTGAFSAAPRSVLVGDSTTGRTRTPDQPYLYGLGASEPTSAQASYDAPQQRWLPVPREFVSPDGSSYAYTYIQPGPLQGVHLVDVKTGSDRLIPGTLGDTDPRGFHYWVVAFQPEGIYVTRVNQLGGGGLLLLDPGTGALRQVSTDATGGYMFVAGRQGWWTLPSPDLNAASDPYVYHQPLTGVAGQHAETWFQRPGFRMFVLGVNTTGQAVVMAQSRLSDELWLLGTPSSSDQISSVPAPTGLEILPFKTAVADAGGWWIGSSAGVFYASGSKLQQVSTTPAVVVGGCQPPM
ncbi:MAG TPA: hypothetical protein VGV88_02100 [Candidatus Dormibacteraeota bacterium]|nr:hypothetical protein [Candidatus Dormibacteraeota bacterium]